MWRKITQFFLDLIGVSRAHDDIETLARKIVAHLKSNSIAATRHERPWLRPAIPLEKITVPTAAAALPNDVSGDKL